MYLKCIVVRNNQNRLIFFWIITVEPVGTVGTFEIHFSIEVSTTTNT
jgi:hypothetical protein